MPRSALLMTGLCLMRASRAPARTVLYSAIVSIKDENTIGLSAASFDIKPEPQCFCVTKKFHHGKKYSSKEFRIHTLLLKSDTLITID